MCTNTLNSNLLYSPSCDCNASLLLSGRLIYSLTINFLYYNICETDKTDKVLFTSKIAFSISLFPLILIFLISIVQCYSGWRPGEVITLSVNNIDLKNRTYTGGIKTENGINRIVPIHPKFYL